MQYNPKGTPLDKSPWTLHTLKIVQRTQLQTTVLY